MMLRRATPSDLPFLLEVEQRFSSQGLVHSDDGDTHQRKMNDADCAYFIAEEQDAPVGYVVLRGLTAGNRSVELQRIAVAEPGRGHGRRALTLAIDKAFREFGAHRVWLDVFQDNRRARHVYQEAGFVEEGTLRDCITHGERYRSLVVMSLLENERRSKWEPISVAFARFSLYTVAAVFVGLGFMSLVRPTILTALVDIVMPTPIAVMEVRGVYGGFFLGTGVCFLAFARRDRWLQPGLVAQASVFGGFVLGRALGIVVGGAPNGFIALLLAGEIVGLIVAFSLLFRVGPH